MKRLSLFVCLGGCASSPPPAPAPAALPPTDPLAIVETGEGVEPIDPESAATLIDRLEAALPIPADHPLRTPESLDDVFAILKLDQLGLFPYGVAFAQKLEGDPAQHAEALALEAQIELAWGEAYLLPLELLVRLDEIFDEALTALPDTPESAETRAWLQTTLARTERLEEAFQLVSTEHLTAGAERADTLISTHPDSYLGYRVAADYYRTVRDWERFDEMVEKIEARNPKSNGLVFLRGTAAFQRDGDRQEAMSYYRQALVNDPDFVRAQAHLVMIQDDLGAMAEQLALLEKLNPSHQLVVWLGPLVAEAKAL